MMLFTEIYFLPVYKLYHCTDKWYIYNNYNLTISDEKYLFFQTTIILGSFEFRLYPYIWEKDDYFSSNFYCTALNACDI